MTLRANSKAFKAILTCHVSWDQFLPLIWLKFEPRRGNKNKSLLLVVTRPYLIYPYNSSVDRCFVLLMRKLMFREVDWLAQDHTASKRQGWNSKSNMPDYGAVLLIRHTHRGHIDYSYSLLLLSSFFPSLHFSRQLCGKGRVLFPLQVTLCPRLLFFYQIFTLRKDMLLASISCDSTLMGFLFWARVFTV